MNTNIEVYRKLLALRAIFKQVQQISWQVNQLERKFPLEVLDIEQQDELLDIYYDLIPQLEEVLFQLKNEYDKRNNRTRK